MKNMYITFLFLFSFVAIPCTGQEEEVPFVNYEVMPSYIGGESEMYKFIQDRFYFPQDALEKGTFGRVTLRFVVSKTGDVYNVEVVRGIHPDCDSVSIDIVSSMTEWEPGYQINQGKKYYVPVNYTLPIMFSEFKKVDGDTIYWKTDTVATFIDGNENLSMHIEDMVGENILDGEGLVRFVVTKEGRVKDAIVVKEDRPFLQKEALLKAINSMTALKPAFRDGKPVDSFVVVPLSFHKQETIYTASEVMPVFLGGEDAMYQFIQDRFYFPQEVLDKNIFGRAILRFVVSKGGDVEQVQVVRGVHPLCDSLSVDVVRSMPQWSPGYQMRGDRVYVPVYIHVPVVFSEYKVVENKKVYWKTDLSPHFIGGNKSVAQYIEDAVDENILDGEGLVRFIVDKDGTVRDAIVMKEIRPFQQKGELLKAINSMTTWQPAIRDGKPVDSFVVLPLSFEKEEFMYLINPPMPTFPGGEEAMYKFVYENFSFSGEQPFEGERKIVVTFTVDKEGKVRNPHLVKSSNSAFDNEVLRVVSLMPDWIPASSGGKNVDSEFSLPIRIRF